VGLLELVVPKAVEAGEVEKCIAGRGRIATDAAEHGVDLRRIVARDHDVRLRQPRFVGKVFFRPAPITPGWGSGADQHARDRADDRPAPPPPPPSDPPVPPTPAPPPRY